MIFVSWNLRLALLTVFFMQSRISGGKTSHIMKHITNINFTVMDGNASTGRDDDEYYCKHQYRRRFHEGSCIVFTECLTLNNWGIFMCVKKLRSHGRFSFCQKKRVKFQQLPLADLSTQGFFSLKFPRISCVIRRRKENSSLFNLSFYF